MCCVFVKTMVFCIRRARQIGAANIHYTERIEEKK